MYLEKSHIKYRYQQRKKLPRNILLFPFQPEVIEAKACVFEWYMETYFFCSVCVGFEQQTTEGTGMDGVAGGLPVRNPTTTTSSIT